MSGDYLFAPESIFRLELTRTLVVQHLDWLRAAGSAAAISEAERLVAAITRDIDQFFIEELEAIAYWLNPTEWEGRCSNDW